MNTLADELVSIQTGSRVCPLDALVVWRGLLLLPETAALCGPLRAPCSTVTGEEPARPSRSLFLDDLREEPPLAQRGKQVLWWIEREALG
jgi:hypothetical protein